MATKNAASLAAMRASGQIAARVRDAVAQRAAPGIATDELEDLAARLIKEAGAESAFFGYRGYPGQICVSINEEVVHGIPSARRIELGDVVSIDVGVRYQGYCGDTATTVLVGVVDAEVLRLVDVAKRALAAGIEMAGQGTRVSDISHAIEKTVVAAGFTVVRKFVGHGIGRQLHEEPQVPNFGGPGRGPRLRKGMTMALEPMVNMGGAAVKVLDDDWTVVTCDGKPSVHFEHTVAVGDQGVEVLTL